MIGEMFRKLSDRISRDWAEISTSLAIHAVLVLLLLLFVVDTGMKPKKMLQVMEEPEEQKEEELEELVEDKIDLETPLSIMEKSVGTLSESTELLKGDPSPTNEAAMAREINEKSRNRPLTSSLGKLNVGSLINGMKGSADQAGGGLGSGALDVITREILRNLRKGPVIVAWIMDPTESMAPTRELIANRFDSIYKELGTVGAIRNDSLLTAVVSCGSTTKFMTPKPSSNPTELAAAMRAIKGDSTGVENFFDGVVKTSSEYRRFQAGGKRIFMQIIVTDEIGDDSQNIDEATKTAQRNKVLVYVLGPASSFGANEMLISTTDSSGSPIEGYINRGPATRAPEIVQTPFSNVAYKHAFGPFGLSYISRETGAIYWIFDDGRLTGPDYDTAQLGPYKPFYGTTADYAKEIGKSELRRAMSEVAVRGDKIPIPKTPETPTFLAENAGKVIPELEKKVAPWVGFARSAIPRLEAADAKRKEEVSPAWLANFDLSMGRLLQGKVTAESYLAALQKAKGPIGAQGNAWQIQQTGDVSSVGGLGGGVPVDPNTPPSALANAPPSALIEKARVYFQRVIDEHPNTPWATAAQAEMGQVMGFDAVATTVNVQPAGGNGPAGGNRNGNGNQGGGAGPPAKPPGPPGKL